MKTFLLFVLAVLLHGLPLLPASLGAAGAVSRSLITQATAQSAPAPARALQAASLPRELDVTLRYHFQGKDDVGTPHVVLCRTQEWLANLRLKLRQTKVSSTLVEYEASGGRWQQEGTCSGEYSWERGGNPNAYCTWTVEGAESGSGTFPSDEARAQLHVNLRSGTFSLGFGLNSVDYQDEWIYTGDCSPSHRDGGRHHRALRAGGLEGTAEIVDGRLILTMNERRTWDNPNHESLYVSTHSGRIGPQEEIKVAIEGPSCGCIAAEDVDGTLIRFTATASEAGGSFTRFSVQPAGAPPRELLNLGGESPRLELAATRETGAATLSITYEKDGSTFKAEPFRVEWCAMDSIRLAGGKHDLSFDGSTPGRLKVEASSRAWHNGRDVSAELTWKLEKIDDVGTRSPASSRGERAVLTYVGLPARNDVFGERELSAELSRGRCECKRQTTIRTFYLTEATNHPATHPAIGPMSEDVPDSRVPNWYYYWTQGAVPDLDRFLYASTGNPFGVANLETRKLYIGRLGAGHYAAYNFTLHREVKWIRHRPRSETIVCRPAVGSVSVAATHGLDTAGRIVAHELYHLKTLTLHDPGDGDGMPPGPEGWEDKALCLDPTDSDTHNLAIKKLEDPTLPEQEQIHQRMQYRSRGDAELPAIIAENNSRTVERLDWSCGGKQWQGGECPR